MPAQRLPCPPISGTLQERYYEVTGSCTWVEFPPADGLPWAGVFGHLGHTRSSDVLTFAADRFAFVMAGGVGWIVDVRTGDLRLQTAEEELVTATAVPGDVLVAAASWTHVYLYSASHVVWQSDRVACDGIRLDSF